jgi:hypothetical protein
MLEIRDNAMAKIDSIAKLRIDDLPSKTISSQTVSGLFNITQSFDTSLPLCSLLLERSPYSNLAMSPQVNVRQVDPSAYLSPRVGHSAISEAIMKIGDTTFSARKMVFFPYTIKKLEGDYDESVSLISVARGQYNLQNHKLKNTSVSVPNLQVSNINSWDVERFAALLDYPAQNNNDTIDFEAILRKDLPLSANADIIEFFHVHNIPSTIIDIKLRFEVNMRTFASFLRMCSNIRLAQPEGQHRMECASRVLYGYKLDGSAPLRDETEKRQAESQTNDLRYILRSVPSETTIFGNIPCVVYYQTPGAPAYMKFSIIHIKALKELSSRVQSQSKLEVESTYHSFYMDLNREINHTITSENLSLLTEKNWANLSMKDIAENSEEQKTLLALNSIISRLTVNRIYHSLPFNKHLPRKSKQGPDTITITAFFEKASASNLWPTNCLRPKLYNVNLAGRVKGNLKPFQPNYIEIRTLWKAIDNVQDQVLLSANWSVLPVHILFDMFFAMKTEQVATKALSAYLSFGDPNMRFYNPYWLATYVFAPVNTITHTLVYNMSNILDLDSEDKKRGGANASSKHKLFVIIKRLLLVEYFQTIITHASSTDGNTNKYFIALRDKHETETLSFQQPAEDHKLWMKCVAFLDMVLLTLPEKILVKCHDKPHQSLVGPIKFEFIAKTTGRYNEEHIPTLENFLPSYLQPSTILSTEKIRDDYTTPHLATLFESILKTKNTKGKPKSPPKNKNATTSPSNKNTANTQKDTEPAIDYSDIIRDLDIALKMTTTLETNLTKPHTTKRFHSPIKELKNKISEITENLKKRKKPLDEDEHLPPPQEDEDEYLPPPQEEVE